MTKVPFYLVVLVLFAWISPCLSSQARPRAELEVVFLDGILEIRDGSSWIETDVGDLIDRESYVRLEENGIVELFDGSLSVTISRSGVYHLADLVRKIADRSSSKDLGRFLENAFQEVAGKPRSRTTAAVLGARAKEADDPEIGWIDEEEEILREGKDLLEEGKYEEALRFFQDAESEAIDEEEQHFTFYVGYTLALLGKKGAALKKLADIDAEVTAPYYEDWVLVQGQLFYESMAYERAVRLFEEYLTGTFEGDNRQAISFLSALCYRELGDTEQAKKHLDRAYRIDPDSEIGRAARNQM
jgi:outer membrane protein assembly factor BamD (BamD/ComL family)